MISEKNKIIYSKNRRSRVKVEKDLSSMLLKSFYVIKLPHHSKKKSTAFDTEISTEIPIALKPPSHRVWIH